MSDGMHGRSPDGFKRQVVFRIGGDEWPLLERAAKEHGSIQAAVLAGLRALAGRRAELAPERRDAADALEPPDPERRQSPDVAEDADEEIPARAAAEFLGLKASTVRGYIRAGRIPGRYDGAPDYRGWMTTRRAVEEYRRRDG